MAWLKLVITTGAEQVDELTALLEQFDASSISFSPATEEAIFDEPSDPGLYWQQTHVSALLDSEVDLDILLACVRNRIGTENIFSHKIEALKDENWVEAHKAGHGPMVFADRLCVCPTWSEAPDAGLATVVLDPGLAFGTGTHATTSLCLGWIAEQDVRDKLVIDYGCGSGILGLAIASMGARTVYGTDIDPQALSATMSNARQNNLQERIEVTLAGTEELPVSDMLIANILLNPLLELAPHFAELLKNEGKLALSGILATQVEECLAAYSQWFKMDEPVFKDEWALITGVREA